MMDHYYMSEKLSEYKQREWETQVKRGDFIRYDGDGCDCPGCTAASRSGVNGGRSTGFLTVVLRLFRKLGADISHRL
ncbi:hypothetical protein [Paenibacillus sp. NEAU-GSW1]|uniref:hypothetical protein n=1 Tax=Paenibacillus sp. NEAU-GSW1 TaxID=2682486 RepID=UPI0012E2BF54|nr:hypothetical protein [Paenibacillus sp. NEAU-GSW1]MUT65712.1 hypothetical protein [Paenibacillus sp. NEAU-GSW1]